MALMIKINFCGYKYVYEKFYKLQSSLQRSLGVLLHLFGLPSSDLHFQTRPFNLGPAAGNKFSCLLSLRNHATRIEPHRRDYGLSSAPWHTAVDSEQFIPKRQHKRGNKANHPLLVQISRSSTSGSCPNWSFHPPKPSNLHITHGLDLLLSWTLIATISFPEHPNFLNPVWLTNPLLASFHQLSFLDLTLGHFFISHLQNGSLLPSPWKSWANRIWKFSLLHRHYV